MTVSPGGPQGAKGLTPEVADGGNPEAIAKETGGVAIEVLPPTLFQLPNLDPSHSTSKPVIAASQDPDNSAVATFDPTQRHEASKPAEPIFPSAPTAGTVKTENVDDPAFAARDQEPIAEQFAVSAVPVPDAIETTRESRLADLPTSSKDEDSRRSPMPPARLPIEVPAGRAWSESIGSQGIVIALLVIVVAAALMSRSGVDDESTKSALAEHSDLLEFDRGDSIVIPETGMPETGMPETGDPNAALPEYGMPGVSLAQETDRESWATNSFSDQVSGNDVAGVSDVTEMPKVALEPPTIENSLAKAEVATSTEDVRENQFFAASSQLEAQAVSDRSEPEFAPGVNRGVDSAVLHRRSSTPAEMKNLLQYLPPVPESVTQAPAVGIGAQAEPSYAK
ncbi:MAG: hypothetical protein GY904_12110 [Planctomycetaceae bacterium]|nr:hypothetical protein [Planctomycetaceae bacterium]